MFLKNKNCVFFVYDWIKQFFFGFKVDDGQQSVEILSVISVLGDCDFGQCKGKWVEIQIIVVYIVVLIEIIQVFDYL